jgi:hypothetical protein
MPNKNYFALFFLWRLYVWLVNKNQVLQLGFSIKHLLAGTSLSCPKVLDRAPRLI